MIALVIVPWKPDYRFGITQVSVLLLPRVAGVQVPLEVLRVTQGSVTVVFLIGQGAQGAIVQLRCWCAVVESQWLRRTALATDVSEAVGGHRAAAPRALRPARGALAA